MRSRLFAISIRSVFLLSLVAISHDGLAQANRYDTKVRAAATNGKIEELEQLKSLGADLADQHALVAAIRQGHVDTVKYLVQQGAQPNGGKSPGTPLYAAASAANKIILQYLIDRGAKIDAEAPFDSSKISTPLLNAINAGDIAAARLLISFGANVNHVSLGGNTPLLQALTYTSNKNTEEFVELILKNGADPDTKLPDGTTPRQYARMLGTFPPKTHAGSLKLVEKYKPTPTKKVAPLPTFSYSLEALTRPDLKNMFGDKLGNPSETKPPTGLIYLDGLPVMQECHAERDFQLGSARVFQIKIALCGQGPFDEVNIANTASSGREQTKVLLEQQQLPDLKTQTSKAISPTLKQVSYIFYLEAGHGGMAVYTSAIVDSMGHTSFVVQYLLTQIHELPYLEKLTSDLYYHVTKGNH
jgi:hypothetical protein